MKDVKDVEDRIQRYEIDKGNSFDLTDIFECGQCFRWNKRDDGSYIGVFGNNVIEASYKNDKVVFEGVCDENIQLVVSKYFDLERDYDAIKSKLSLIDDSLKNSIEYGKGIRLLNQDLWETIISFIISANNNIPRIKGIIERLCKNYGKEILYKGECYYTFPSAYDLKDVSVSDFRKLGLGFRDVRLFETTHMVLNNEVDLEGLKGNLDTTYLRNELLKLSGVGLKVADCILLFSELKRLEVFPIDVWVRRVMNDLYIKNPDESKVSKKAIMDLANDMFGDLAGIAQQYLFYWRREN